MELKPKDTVYNGYRFRSRLEARWAVFFDEARIHYEYEPEGFDLKNGESYLPDFYLPDFELYVEIKPFDHKVVKWVGDGNQWEKKCERFRDVTGQAILLCYGDPATALFHYLFAFDYTDSGGGNSEYYCLFSECKGAPVLCTAPQRSDRTILITEFETSNFVGTPRDWAGDDEETYWDQSTTNANIQNRDAEKNRLYYARIAARQARFEFGETPIAVRNDGLRW